MLKYTERVSGPKLPQNPCERDACAPAKLWEVGRVMAKPELLEINLVTPAAPRGLFPEKCVGGG